MSLIYEERESESPYVDTILHGWTLADDAQTRPATSHWHIVFTKHEGRQFPIVVGPWTTAGTARWSKDAEIVWVRLKLGTFIPSFPVRKLVDTELVLPEASDNSFWLNGSAWQFPDYENIDTFIARLARSGALVRDPVVHATLQDHLPDSPSRTVRHRFLQATGLSRSRIQQINRAQQALNLLQQGVAILDVVDQIGYADQPHLTRSLKRFTGYTPAQVARSSA